MSYKYKDENGIIHDIADNYEVQEPGYEVYSLQETLCGEWLGKPLYRRVIQTTIPATTTDGTMVTSNISLASLGLDGVVDMFKGVNAFMVFDYGTNNQVWQLPWLYSTSYMIRCTCTRNNITITNNYKTYNGTRCFVILEYTKR